MTLWYIARAAGLVALAALTLATALGAFASVQPPRGGLRTHRWRFALQYVHRAAAATGLILLVAHVGTLVLDSYSGVNLQSAVIPFTASYRPLAVGLGTLALFATVLTALVGAARGRLATSVRAARSWRALHLTAYGAWALAMGHGFLAGTDSFYGPVFLGYVLALVLVGGSVAARLWSYQRAQSGLLAGARRATLDRETRSVGV